MGRRGNMRARPGLLFIIVFAVCLAIVYLSWRSMSPSTKVKDAYSVKMQTLLDDGSKFKNFDPNREGENHARDPDYDIENVQQNKVVAAPSLPKYELSNDREENPNKQDLIKQPSIDVKIPEKQHLETDNNEFYKQPINLISETVKSMERFVHLDLKGAAPKMSYLKDFIPLVRKLGATGLLIEYEDMFPYSGMLKYTSAKNAYTMDDIRELLGYAKVNNLKVMPLIQTFGHMEFILKSDFNKLRESRYTPQVIDITQNASYSLISEMVKQILNAHPDASHLHIGCDEVYELGRGASSIEMKSKKLSEFQIFLRHVKQVADIVYKYSGGAVTPVMWDDELRKMPLSDIENSRLPSSVEIMVWHYTKYVSEKIADDVWDKYSKAFKSVWIASAFKGATGARQFFTEPQYHIQNHFGWLDVIAANNQRLTFKGVALTGWQRYDHFATLCELLPVAIPSLAVCLATIVNAGFTKEIHMATSKLIYCGRNIEMTFPEIDKKTERAIVTQDCRFPGNELYHSIQELYGYVEGMPSINHRLDGWLSDYQVAHQFSSPGQLQVLSRSLAKQSSGYTMVTVPLQQHLANIYFDDTVDEWMDENIKGRQRRIEEHQKKIQSMGLHNTWPQRPLPLVSDSKKNSKFNETSSGSDNGQSIQNMDADSQRKQFNKNMSFIKPMSKFPSQQDGQHGDLFKIEPHQQEISIKSKTVNGEAQIKELDERNSESNHRLPKLPELDNWIDSRVPVQQNFNGKRSSDVVGDLNKNNNTFSMKSNRVDRYKENQNHLNINNDGNGKVTAEVKPDRYRPIAIKDIGTQEKPHSDNIKADPQVDQEDQMRRDKYLKEDKNSIQTGRVQPSLKYQRHFKAPIPEKGKLNDDFYKEDFKSKAESAKASLLFKQSGDIDDSHYKEKFGIDHHQQRLNG